MEETMNDNNTEYTICPCCRARVPFGKFCPECGSPLVAVSDAGPAAEQQTVPAEKQKIGFYPATDLNVFFQDEAGIGIHLSDQNEAPEEPQPADDSGLTLLGDFCKKTVATIGGDGYDEIVLYKNEEDGSFQIHTYSKYAYMQKELHRSFKAKDGAYEALLELVKKLHLDEYEGKIGVGLCGGMYVCKYKKDGVLHRVTTDNLGVDGTSIIMQVGNLLASFQGEACS